MRCRSNEHASMTCRLMPTPLEPDGAGSGPVHPRQQRRSSEGAGHGANACCCCLECAWELHFRNSVCAAASLRRFVAVWRVCVSVCVLMWGLRVRPFWQTRGHGPIGRRDPGEWVASGQPGRRSLIPLGSFPSPTRPVTDPRPRLSTARLCRSPEIPWDTNAGHALLLDQYRHRWGTRPTAWTGATRTQ